MTPEDLASLDALRRMLLKVAVGVSVVLLLPVTGIGIYLALNPDYRQHLLGQSERHEAVVTEVARGRSLSCRNNSRDSTYTLEWAEEGTTRTEQIERCGNPYDDGENVVIWSTDGMPFTDSATLIKVLFGGLLILFLAPSVWLMRKALRLHRVVSRVCSGEPPAASYRVLGHPGLGGGFHLVDHAPFDPDRLRKGSGVRTVGPPGRGLSTGSAPEVPDLVPGTIWISEMRRNRPRGVLLSLGDDQSRHLRYLG
ncbi:MAG: hypothetical protein L0H93_07650 [Nocardioides sp.]|nr:hypothetical protein [Nocardioides sp.]